MSICLAEVVEVIALTHDVREIGLKLIDPPKLQFVGGQYITIEITEVRHGHARLNNRPYSIVSPPHEMEAIRLCVNRVGEGPGSTYLHSLKQGDRLAFQPPAGFFTLDHQKTTALLFVATGTGIAPILSMIGSLFATGSVRPIMLHWGLRREEDLYYQELLAEWACQFPHFQYVTTLSQPSSLWQGPRGRVTDHLPKEIAGWDHSLTIDPESRLRHRWHVNDVDAYLCGHFDMIKEVRALLLSHGVAKTAIHFEKFY